MRTRALLLLATFTAASPPLRAQLEPEELLTIPHILRTPLIAAFALAPDGKQVALSISVLGKETIWLIPGDGTAGGPIATSKGTADRDPDWSPEGSSLSFVSNRDLGWKLYVADAKGANARVLTANDGDVKQPRWSPDGKWIAYLSRAISGESGWDLWVVSSDGTGTPRQLTSEPLDEEDPRWSPD
ncbi:MAG: TolB family protein, partial [Vicinamibacteria bacterium]